MEKIDEVILIRSWFGAVAWHKEGFNGFARNALWIRYANTSALADAWVAHKRIFDFDRRNLSTTDVDEILLPCLKVQVPLLVPIPIIAGVKPAGV